MPACLEAHRHGRLDEVLTIDVGGSAAERASTGSDMHACMHLGAVNICWPPFTGANQHLSRQALASGLGSIRGLRMAKPEGGMP